MTHLLSTSNPLGVKKDISTAPANLVLEEVFFSEVLVIFKPHVRGNHLNLNLTT
jgi:hypothetical protein